MTVLLFIGLFILALGLEFIITAGLVWVVCWAFSLLFSWKLVIGIWAVLSLLGIFLRSHQSNSKRSRYDY